MNSNPEVEKEKLKEKNSFEFMVYLHLLGQSIFISILLLFAFQNTFFNTLLKENNIIFYSLLIILIVTTDSSIFTQILNNSMNYFYFVIFTLCISYIFCKIAILFNFYFIMIICLLNILEILYLTIKTYRIKNNKKMMKFFVDPSSFRTCIILISSILCYIFKIGTLKFFIILIIFLLFEAYIIRSMDYILIKERNNFKNNRDYISSVIFLYIIIFRVILKFLKEKYHSRQYEKNPIEKDANVKDSNEKDANEKNKKEKDSNENKPIRKNMIYTGEEDFAEYYKDKDEKDSNEKRPIQKSRIYTGEEDYAKYYKDKDDKDSNENKPIQKGRIYTGEEYFARSYKDIKDEKYKKILMNDNYCGAIKESEEEEENSLNKKKTKNLNNKM